MAYHNVRSDIAITTILVLALATAATAGEADCEDVVSPITGTSFKGLIWRAIDLGATKAELYQLVSRSRCRIYLEQLIDSTQPKQGANHG